MIDRRFVLLLLVVAATLQLGVTLASIYSREQTLTEGVPVKLPTAPVDPYDAFRGRYVALGFPIATVEQPGIELERNQKVFVVLVENADGFGEIAELRTELPPADLLYFRAEVAWVGSDGKARLRLPFDRYYMEERKAPAAERVYRDLDERQEAWVVVRLRRGDAVIEQLFVGGLPVEEYLERQPSGIPDSGEDTSD